MYSPNASSTATETSKELTGQYADGSEIAGTIYKDTVTVGGLTATKLAVAAATTVYSSFATDPNDGILGMGYAALSSSDSKPLIQQLLTQNAISSGVFSFRLTESGSEVVFGTPSSSLYDGEIAYTNVTKQGVSVVIPAAMLCTMLKLTKFACVDSIGWCKGQVDFGAGQGQEVG